MDSPILDTYSYTYDEENNLTSETKASGKTIYTYDPLNRIQTVTEPQRRTTVYSYDGSGNRLTKSIDYNGTAIITQYNYDSFNRLRKEMSDDGTTILYTYDKDGNQTSRLEESGTSSTGATAGTAGTPGTVSGSSLIITSVSECFLSTTFP